jgi:uncharacterized membrane protein YcaP (DUF421 family)
MLERTGGNMCHETLFHLCVPAGEKVVRVVVIYAFLVVALRLAGKRELAQLSAFDLVVLITISNAVQNAIIGADNTISGGMIGAATLLAVNNIVVRLARRFPMLDQALEGKEVVLYADGAVIYKALKRQLITEGELMTAARVQGARSLHEVERIAIEPNGTLVVEVKQDATLHKILNEIKELRAEVDRRG